MSDKGITLEGLAAAVDALRQELATWKALARKQDTLTAAQITATQSGATAAKIDQIAVNTAAIQALSAQVAGQISLEYVTTLPATGEPFTLYLVPQGDGTAPNYCNEYLWVNDAWELIGTTGSMANNGELTIQVNGVAVGTFTANQAANTAVNIAVPTNNNQLINGAQYVDAAALQTALALKQNNLNTAQLDAVNSGITSALVTQIGTNATAIAGKQDALTTAQQAAVDSGATAAKIGQIATNAAAIVALTSSKQDALSTAQLAAVNSGITSAAVAQISTNTGAIATKAADSDVVHLAGAETITGDKTWTGNNTFSSIKSTGVIRVEKSSGDTEFEIVNGEVDATTNTLSRQDDIRFYDKNTKITGGLRLTYTTDTGTKIELYARSWKADGTASYNRSLTIYTNGQTGEYYTTLETNFQPKTTGVYSLGASSYQWTAVYAQTYYYNGAEFQNKFVTTDTAQTITKTKTLQADSQTPDIYHNSSSGFNRYRTRGTSNYANYDSYLRWAYSAHDNFIVLNRSVGILGSTTEGATVDDIDTSFNLFKIHIGYKAFDLVDAVKATNNGTENSLKPITTSVTDLGTSTNKWKTLNGINPGALSFPANSCVDIDTTGWTAGGANRIRINNADPTYPGWLFVRLSNIDPTTDYCNIRLFGNNVSDMTVDGAHTGTNIRMIVPVPANTSVIVYCSVIPTYCRYYACLGNV